MSAGEILGNVFLGLFICFLVAMAFVLLLIPIAAMLFTIADIFHREDIRAGKLVWTLVVLLAPLIGLAAYWLSKPTEAMPVTYSWDPRPSAASEAEHQPRRAA